MKNAHRKFDLETLDLATESAKKPHILDTMRSWVKEGFSSVMLKKEELSHYTEALVNNKPAFRDIIYYLDSPLPEARKAAWNTVKELYAEFVQTIAPIKGTSFYKMMTISVFATSMRTACGQSGPNAEVTSLHAMEYSQHPREGTLEEKNNHLENQLKKLSEIKVSV